MRSLTLNNGVEIPQLGFGSAAIGSWQRDDGYVKDVILSAINAGYRHIDTASVYGNERSVGQAIKESGLPREEFFIVSKVWDSQQGYQETLAAHGQSLARLDIDYLDLYLVHWPFPEKTQATWQALETLFEDKKVRALGLSNFRKSDIEALLSFANVPPTYNQLELHPYLQQDALCEFCTSKNIAVACWSPLGSGSWSGVPVSDKPIADTQIKKIAEKHGVSAAQVIIKWNIQQGRIVIPKAESAQHIAGNLNIMGFELSSEDIAQIRQLNRNQRFGGDPSTSHSGNMRIRVPD